jgi:phospholipid-binding lipoprotein MlaA
MNPAMRHPLRMVLRAPLLAALVAFATQPAWAQQAGLDAPNSPVNQPSATSAQPIEVVPPSGQDAETPQQKADDAQLPAYLQNNSGTETGGTAYDPWERYNRRVYRFNKRLDTTVAKPLAQAYVHDVPQPMRNGVSHFFRNLAQPVTALNLLLQGHPTSACKSLGRFAVNTTLGIGGVFDPATRMHIPPYNEDFGQTLGHWGWRRSRYFLLPFAGPGTLRDRIGSLTDAQIGPYRYIQPLGLRVAVAGVSLVDTRARILPLDELSAGIEDDYLLVREAWSQRRMHQIDDQNASITGQAAEDSLKSYDFPEDHPEAIASPQAQPSDTQPVQH